MYVTRYTNKNGSSEIHCTTNSEKALSKLKSCFNKKIEATVELNGKEIGRSWKDGTQKMAWNYIIETN